MKSKKDIQKRYNESPKGNARRKKHAQSPKGKAWLKKFQQSAKGKAIVKRYQQTLKGKEARKRHEQTPMRKVYLRKYEQTPKRRARLAKRQRQLGFVPVMSNPFPQEVKIAWHHINKKLVFPMPRRLHEINAGQQHKGQCENALDNLGFGLKHFEENRQ